MPASAKVIQAQLLQAVLRIEADLKLHPRKIKALTAGIPLLYESVTILRTFNAREYKKLVSRIDVYLARVKSMGVCEVAPGTEGDRG